MVDVDSARMSRASDGAVVFDDPNAPWVVRLWTRSRGRGRPVVSRIAVTARNGGEVGITADRLGRLPISQMLHLASTEPRAVKQHPNEVYWRMLARPKAYGQRSWTDDHWDTVYDVYQWAVETGRPGGGTQAIADMWGVAKKPTAERWRAIARARRGAGT